jgi:N-acetylglucosaminyldiphosphoundecaprenol N-acetyl-beta-D-mannosaminyltransferase
MRKLLVIAGVPIDDLTMPEALERIEEFVASGRPHQIATVNADFVVKAWDDAELRYILQGADMLTADGMPLVWGARLLGVPLQGRVTGADLVPALAGRAAERGWRVYFLGARPGVAARAAEALRERNPRLQIAGTTSPPLSPVVAMDPDIVRQVRAACPDILLVAFGNPKQEKWIRMNLEELGVPVAIGVGGTLDFIAGEVQRAPLWMQRYGLEWFYRLVQEPGRMWRRYVLDFVQFGRFFIAQWWRQRSGRSLPTVEIDAGPASIGENRLSLAGAITAANSPQVVRQIEKALAHDPRLFVQMAEVTFIDSSGMGSLVNVTKQARAAGGDLTLLDVRPQVRRTLELLRLDQFLTLAGGPVRRPEARPGWRRIGEWQVRRLPERLDAASTPAERGELERMAAAPARIVIDFDGTTFLDSSGISALVAIQRMIDEQGGELRLAGLARDVRRVLDLSGVSRIFKIYQTAEAAARGDEGS